MLKSFKFRRLSRNIMTRLAAWRKPQAVPALLVAFMACNIFPADASIVTLRVRPYKTSDYKYHRIGNVTLDNTSFRSIFCTDLFTASADAAVGCEIFHQCQITGNVGTRTNLLPPDNLISNRLIIGSWDNKDNIDDSGDINFTLTDSGITSHDGKWKINGIDLYVWNINAEEDIRNTYGNICPCRLTVNGETFPLEESKEMIVLHVPFEGDEQWMSNIILRSDPYQNVGVSKIVLHIDDVNGFNSIDPYADRLDYDKDGNKYNIPSVLFGRYDFKEQTRLAVLDSEGNVLDNVNAEYTEDGEKYGFFQISTEVGTDSLTEGKYYACHYIDVDDIKEERQIPAAQISDCIPFEIVPVLDHMALNWGKLEKAGYNKYTCKVPPEIRQPISNGDSITRGWTNAHISGHLPGTVVYWKLLTQEEADSYTLAPDLQGARSAVRRVTASIPEGFIRLTGAGVDLSGGADLKEGYLGIVLSRNGVISDPKVIHYTYDKDFPTNVSELDSDTAPQTQWYTIDGMRVLPGRCPSGTMVIRVDRYPDGRTVSHKVALSGQ